MNKLRLREQGDVGILTTTTIPADAKPLKSNVLQEGEHTGHAHRITSGAAQLFDSPNGVRYMRVAAGGATITHEEHYPVTIEEGEYEIRIVRQKDLFSKIISKVVD